ncbi:hypothetical protein COOONC_28042 [Cooperia oncophora]
MHRHVPECLVSLKTSYSKFRLNRVEHGESTKSSTVFEPPANISPLRRVRPKSAQRKAISSLLPEAAGYWEDVLRVARTEAPIRLRRKCTSSFYYYRNEKKSVACDRGCRAETNCGETIIPNEHLLFPYGDISDLPCKFLSTADHMAENRTFESISA